jgi:hypothetical protein
VPAANLLSGYYAAVRLHTPDLLDANESTWAFVEVDGVGCDENYEVRTFATLAS